MAALQAYKGENKLGRSMGISSPCVLPHHRTSGSATAVPCFDTSEGVCLVVLGYFLPNVALAYPLIPSYFLQAASLWKVFITCNYYYAARFGPSLWVHVPYVLRPRLTSHGKLYSAALSLICLDRVHETSPIKSIIFLTYACLIYATRSE